MAFVVPDGDQALDVVASSRLGADAVRQLQSPARVVPVMVLTRSVSMTMLNIVLWEQAGGRVVPGCLKSGRGQAFAASPRSDLAMMTCWI